MDLHGINPRDIKPVSGEPINKLIWAVNHYVSTGDHIGVGSATRHGDMWHLMIPVWLEQPQDQQDMAALRSRLEQLPDLHKLGYLGEARGTEGWILMVADGDIAQLTEALITEPGPLGWGSGKAVIDQYAWRHE